MFTIGIFTTHLPYIAFVVFYAFCLLSGVQKASAGELQWGESNIIFKTPENEIPGVNSADLPEYHYQHDATFLAAAPFDVSAFFVKIQYASFYPENIRKCYFSQAILSRPPPVLS